MISEDLGQYIIRTFELEEDEYTYEHNKLGYTFYLHPRNKLKKLRPSLLEKVIKDYCEEKKYFMTRKQPISYTYLDTTETIRLETTKDNAIKKIRVTQIKNRQN